jgi:CRP-like cAMP-binding protein
MPNRFNIPFMNNNNNNGNGNTTTTLTPQDEAKCEALLSGAEMFKCVPPHLRYKLIQEMKPRVIKRNESLLIQGAPSDRFFLVDSGDVRRTFIDPDDGKVHNVQFAIVAKTINSMRVLSGDAVMSTVKCVSEKCKVYEMMRTDLLRVLKTEPDITLHIAEGLCAELRVGSRKFATPLLEQQQQEINVPAVSIAAGIESYYRSGLNSMLNARLTGVRGDLFPNMHIQVPTRIAYITGFKGLRHVFQKNIHADQYEYPTAVRLFEALAPGIIMTPISSLLEATHAGHINTEPMQTRWMRGLAARSAREIVFGVGLNQMSDYFEERLTPFFGVGHAMMANAAGSLVAGVVSGYLSHVPHNMSTFKLLEPHRTYRDLFMNEFVKKSCPRVVNKTVSAWPETTKLIARMLFATLFPRGVMIRTTQIVGSFIILNGTINYLQLKEHQKIHKIVNGLEPPPTTPSPSPPLSEPPPEQQPMVDTGEALVGGRMTTTTAETPTPPATV